MNPPTLVTNDGLALCADHAARWARGGIVAHLPRGGELEGRGCHNCELEYFVSSLQVVTSLVRDAVEDNDDYLPTDEPFPLDVIDTTRLGPAVFALVLRDGTRWSVTVAPAGALEVVE